MAFPVTGRCHGLALGTKKVARDPAPVQVRDPAPVQVQRHFLCPKLQAMGTPSNWERPVTGNAITLNGNAITFNGNAGVGWRQLRLFVLPAQYGKAKTGKYGNTLNYFFFIL